MPEKVTSDQIRRPTCSSSSCVIDNGGELPATRRRPPCVAVRGCSSFARSGRSVSHCVELQLNRLLPHPPISRRALPSWTRWRANLLQRRTSHKRLPNHHALNLTRKPQIYPENLRPAKPEHQISNRGHLKELRKYQKLLRLLEVHREQRI